MSDTLRDLRASLVAVLLSLMFVLGMPLCDTTVGATYATEAQREAYRAEAGWPLSELVITAAWINNHGRTSVVRALAPFERALWIDQYWNLYPIKSPRWRTTEILIDDVDVYRRGDPTLRWNARLWDSFELRQTLNNLANRPALAREAVRFVVELARAENPAVERVEVHAILGRYPGVGTRVSNGMTAEAPAFEVVAW